MSKEPKFQWPMTWLFQVVRLSDARFFMGWSQIDFYDEKLIKNSLGKKKLFKKILKFLVIIFCVTIHRCCNVAINEIKEIEKTYPGDPCNDM